MGGILTGAEICSEVAKGRIVIDNFDPSRVGPNSYDLHLHSELKLYRDSCLDMRRQHETVPYVIPEEGTLLEPGHLHLGRTVERTFTKHYVPMIEGRSSIGRLGMSIHVTAGFGDVGFDNFWTLEIHVIQPLQIYPGVKICQVYFMTPVGEIREYKGKYQKDSSDEIGESQLWRELRKDDSC